MKTVLILGITGNFGLEMALALKAQGWIVKALLRDEAKAPQWLEKENRIIGDANEQEKVMAAANGVDLIVYGLSPAYHRWHIEALALLEPCVATAEKLGIRLLFPGNVYNFEPSESRISESQVMKPVTEKGAIRVAMEARLRKASEHGAKVTIVRAGDFIGPNTHMTWMDRVLKEKHGEVKMAFPHDEKHVHFWSYLPDLCANTAMLMDMPQASFEIWHDSGLALNRADWQKAFAANGRTLKVSNFSWWILTIIAPVVPLVKEVLKMKYLWQQPVVLDGGKMKRALGEQYRATDLTAILPQITQA